MIHKRGDQGERGGGYFSGSDRVPGAPDLEGLQESSSDDGEAETLMAAASGSRSEVSSIPREPTSTVISSVLYPAALPASTRSWYLALFRSRTSAMSVS